MQAPTGVSGVQRRPNSGAFGRVDEAAQHLAAAAAARLDRLARIDREALLGGVVAKLVGAGAGPSRG